MHVAVSAGSPHTHDGRDPALWTAYLLARRPRNAEFVRASRNTGSMLQCTSIQGLKASCETASCSGRTGSSVSLGEIDGRDIIF